MMKKEDLRITKTKRDLRHALLELLKTNQFEKITVADICDEAMVNRMTFYKHFKDKYDLLQITITNLVDNIMKRAKELAAPVCSFDDHINFSCVLARTIILDSAEKRDILPALCNGGSGIVYEVLSTAMREYIFMLVKQVSQFKKLKYSVENTVDFLAGGIIQVLYNWLANVDKYNVNQYAEECTVFTKDLLLSSLFFE